MKISLINLTNFGIKTKLNNLNFGNKSTPLYAVNAQGDVYRFEGQRDAGRKLGMKPQNIHACLKGKSMTAGGYSFRYASKIDKFEKGSKEYNQKIATMQNEAKNAMTPVPVYAISADGEILEFDNLTQAASAIGVTPAAVDACVSKYNKRANAANGYALCRKEELDALDKNSEEYKNKIDKMKLWAKKNAARARD